jgi:hypothetical protein
MRSSQGPHCECRPNPDRLKDPVLLRVHPGRSRVFMIIVPQAVQSAMDDVEQKFPFGGVAVNRPLSHGLVVTDQDVDVESTRARIGQVKGKDICRARNTGESLMGRGHCGVVDHPNPNFAGNLKLPDGLRGMLSQPSMGRRRKR